MVSTRDLEDEFHLVMIEIHRRAKSIGYSATYFRRMVEERWLSGMFTKAEVSEARRRLGR